MLLSTIKDYSIESDWYGFRLGPVMFTVSGEQFLNRKKVLGLCGRAISKFICLVMASNAASLYKASAHGV